MKRIASLLLVLSLCLTPALAAQPGFSDVPGDAWYAPYVQVCTEAGLMEGTGGGQFQPDAPLSLAQGLVLAARAYSFLRGDGGVVPSLPSDLNDMVRFLDDTGEQLGNWADVAGLGGGNIFVAFGADFLARLDLSRPLTMVLDIAALDWSTFDMDPDSTLSYTGYYREEENAAAGGVMKGYYFDAGQDFDNNLWEALSLGLDLFIDENQASHKTYSSCWYYDETIYLLQRINEPVRFGENHPTPDTFDPAYLDTENAWREDLAFLFYQITSPLDRLPINDVTALPDTDNSEVLSLYSSGILTGEDASGAFSGSRTVTRAEAAAMLARLICPTLRVRVGSGTAHTMDELSAIYISHPAFGMDVLEYKIDLDAQRLWTYGNSSGVGSADFIPRDADAANEGFEQSVPLTEEKVAAFRTEAAPILEWSGYYLNPNVLDGHQWRVMLLFQDGTTYSSQGSNAYPKHWDTVYDALEALTGVPVLYLRSDWLEH